MSVEPYKSLIALAVLVALSILAAPAPAAACSFPAPTEFEIEEGPAPEGVSLPKKPELSVEYIRRGRASGPHSASSCDDIGEVILAVAPTSDTVGYELELTGGDLPVNELRVPDSPVEFDTQGTLQLTWIDESEEVQESFDFTIVATPIDRWGRRGPTSEPLQVTHPGRGGAACSVAGGGIDGAPRAPVSLVIVVSLVSGVAALRRLT